MPDLSVLIEMKLRCNATEAPSKLRRDSRLFDPKNVCYVMFVMFYVVLCYKMLRFTCFASVSFCASEIRLNCVLD